MLHVSVKWMAWNYNPWVWYGALSRQHWCAHARHHFQSLRTHAHVSASLSQKTGKQQMQKLAGPCLCVVVEGAGLSALIRCLCLFDSRSAAACISLEFCKVVKVRVQPIEDTDISTVSEQPKQVAGILLVDAPSQVHKSTLSSLSSLWLHIAMPFWMTYSMQTIGSSSADLKWPANST